MFIFVPIVLYLIYGIATSLSSLYREEESALVFDMDFNYSQMTLGLSALISMFCLFFIIKKIHYWPMIPITILYIYTWIDLLILWQNKGGFIQWIFFISGGQALLTTCYFMVVGIMVMHYDKDLQAFGDDVDSKFIERFVK
jgi:hypothetical protein